MSNIDIDIFEEIAINDDDFEAALAVILADDGDVLEDGGYTSDCPDCEGGLFLALTTSTSLITSPSFPFF